MHNDGSELKYIDLFSGAGGLSVGFERLSRYSFKSVWANDFNVDAVETYNKNFGEICEAGDIFLHLGEMKGSFPRADIVIGGPPCQGFSLLNNKEEMMLEKSSGCLLLMLSRNAVPKSM